MVDGVLVMVTIESHSNRPLHDAGRQLHVLDHKTLASLTGFGVKQGCRFLFLCPIALTPDRL